MIVRKPLCITPRLMPGLEIGGGWVSIAYAHRSGREGRTRYRYAIELPDATEHEGDDLQSGCRGGNLQEGLESLLSFLMTCAESYAYRLRTGRAGDNIDLFPEAVAEWAYEHSDELSTLAHEMAETLDLIEE
jgi:hypothetical protein